MILVSLFILANAKASGQTGGNAALAVILPGAGPSITINNSSVTLEFNSSNDYKNGVHSGTTTNDHITVTSNTGFQVSVKGSGNLQNGGNTLPLSSIIVTPSNGSQTISTTPTYTPTTSGLSTSNQTIISSAVSTTTAAKFNIDYYAQGGSDYIGKETASYSTIITYSVSPN